MQLRPYQLEGVDFLSRTPRALLAFDTRLGKSLTSLTAADAVGAKRVLIIAPAIGRLSWATELAKTGASARIVSPGAKPGAVNLDLDELVLVLAYDTFSLDRHGWTAALMNAPPWDVMILDECQYLKSMGANRTKTVYGLLRHRAARIWLLSGTPTPNHAGELYPHIAALWPELLPGQTTRHEFEDLYCDVETTPWGRRIKGSRNQVKLRDKLAHVVLRRRKQDVFTDLPRVQHNIVPIETKAPPLPDIDVSTLDELLAHPLTTEASSLRRELGEAKAAGAVAWLQEQLSNDIMPGKVVVFAWHRTVLDSLEAGLADFEPVRIDGATSTPARIAAVERFQTNGACRVFIGQLKAAGTAINLDAADDVAIVEASWVPMENYQAASRVENVGARKAVTVSWLTAPGTLDGQISAVLRTKTAQLAAIWD